MLRRCRAAHNVPLYEHSTQTAGGQSVDPKTTRRHSIAALGTSTQRRPDSSNMAAANETPAAVKTRTKKATTTRKTARKPPARATNETAEEAAPSDPSALLQPAATPQRFLRSQQPSSQPRTRNAQQHAVDSLCTEEQRAQEAGQGPAQPSSSSITHTTAPRMSGRLGSRLTGTHAALPAQSGRQCEQVQF